MLTIFSAPKPFQGQIDLIQRNALASWRALEAGVEILLLGDEPGLAQAAADFDAAHLDGIARNRAGTPRVDSIFSLARERARYELMCYVNADIVLLDDLLPSATQVSRGLRRFLIVGRRWDLEVQHSLTFDSAGRERLRRQLAQAGRLHPPSGSDYFVFRRGEFVGMPPFALGRAGWDNWMIYAARAAGMAVVDATEAVTVVHQAHDYAHLPDGQPHYRLPESDDNVRLAGGREMIFTIRDATWRLGSGGLRRQRLGAGGAARGVEAAALARLGPGRAAQILRLLWHPRDTLRYFFGRARGRIRPA